MKSWLHLKPLLTNFDTCGVRSCFKANQLVIICCYFKLHVARKGEYFSVYCHACFCLFEIIKLHTCTKFYDWCFYFNNVNDCSSSGVDARHTSWWRGFGRDQETAGQDWSTDETGKGPSSVVKLSLLLTCWVLGMTLNCLHRVIDLPHPGANDLSCWSAVEHQLSLLHVVLKRQTES